MILPPVNILFWTGQDMILTCFGNLISAYILAVMYMIINFIILKKCL